MDHDTVAALEHENFIEAMAEASAVAPGSLVRREDGVALLASGLPFRLFNQVLVAETGAKGDAIAAAVGTMRDRHARFMVSLRRGVDDRFIGLMAELGLVLPDDQEPMPGMALDPIPDAAPRQIDGYEVRAVTDSAGLEDHIVTAAAGFGMPEDLARSIVAPDLWQRSGRTVYVGYADDAPVATGLGVRTGRAIGVYNIATIETARRRGYGEAMTARVAADGRAAGCEIAILQASEMGRSTYERLGYRTVVEYDGYVDPAG
jgi:GNAT superfamily N-acetyltransferase